MFLLLAVATVNEVPPPPPVPAVVVATPATVTRPVPAAPITVGPITVALPGHYECTGVDNETASCVRDETWPERPANPAGDIPGTTLGSTDLGYGADLTAQLCAVKPWYCD